MNDVQGFDRSITAIIATYNRARYLPQAIDSILAQQEPPTQVIVVDDGSDDDTGAVVAPYAPRVEYLRKPNGGKSSAINLALDHARGQWLWLFDDDDIALPEATRLLLDALHARPEADFVFGGQIIADEAPGGQLVGHREVRATVAPDESLLLNVLQGFCYRLQSMLIRRECVERIGRLDVRFLRGQDYELIIRLARNCRGARVEQPILVWRQHAGERGPASAKHRAPERDRLWGEFDRLLGNMIRNEYALGEFLVPPVRRSDLPPGERAAALFNRSAIMATKGLLPQSSQDLMAAAALLPATTGLSPAQKELVLRTGTNARFSARLAMAPDELIEPLSARPRSRLVRETCACLARALVYLLRHRQAPTEHTSVLRRAALQLALLAGPRALLVALV